MSETGNYRCRIMRGDEVTGTSDSLPSLIRKFNGSYPTTIPATPPDNR
jgi:hypothetical protein